MDKASGKGTFGIRHDPNAKSRGLEEFTLDSEPLETLPPNGVVSIRFELDDGTVSDGFIITHAVDVSAAPQILTPRSSSTVSGANPTLMWAPFRSAEYKPFERRRTVIHVSRQGEDASVWEFFTEDVEGVTEARIGSPVGKSPAVALTPGEYWVSVSSAESRKFGPVEILRSSRLSQPFHVAP
jgi:hypothetical protein